MSLTHDQIDLLAEKVSRLLKKNRNTPVKIAIQMVLGCSEGEIYSQVGKVLGKHGGKARARRAKQRKEFQEFQDELFLRDALRVAWERRDHLLTDP
jgi:hypothetical protein